MIFYVTTIVGSRYCRYVLYIYTVVDCNWLYVGITTEQQKYFPLQCDQFSPWREMVLINFEPGGKVSVNFFTLQYEDDVKIVSYTV